MSQKALAVVMTLLVGLLLLSSSPAASGTRPRGFMHVDRVRQLAAQTEGLSDCLEVLFELRSCTDEIILFFLNGEAYLGQECCRSIRYITERCWPAMFSSIGFTAEEADILRGFCDAAASPPPLAPAARLSPAPALAPELAASPTPVV